MIDCVNNGDITSATSDIAGMVGAIWTNSNDVFAVIADCVNNGSTKHEIYGDTTTNVGKVLRLFVYGCKVGTAASAQNLPVYDETMTDAVTGKVIIPIKTADDFAKIGNTEANALYTADAFYLLDGENGKIDFTGKTYENYVVNNFSGVLYGNNNVLENITLNADSHVGFFRFLSNTNSTAVMKLDFGSKDNEIKITQSNENLRNVGVLAAEIGVAGSDILLEYEPDVYELLDLGVGKCRMCVAAAKEFEDDRSRPLKVATKFPNIASKYYSGISRSIDIIKLHGSIELAPILGLSDVIVDIVETGSTLRENGLEVKHSIVPISAQLIANKASYKFKRAELSALMEKIQKVKGE